MSHILTIAGSPSSCAKSVALLDYAHRHLKRKGLCLHGISVRNLPAAALLHAHAEHPAILDARALVEQAEGIIVATPVCKSAYSGILKAFLDVLPNAILRDKVILPIATGGTTGQVSALQYALKPVLSALGANHLLNGLFIPDAQIQFEHGGNVRIEEHSERHLLEALEEFSQATRRISAHPTIPEWSI